MPPRASRTFNLAVGLRSLAIIAMAMVAVLVVWMLFNLTAVRDWIILASYNPPQSVTAIANEDQMTPYAKNLFYVNRPAILGKSQFAQQCPNRLEQSYVIGCYHGGDNGIFLLDVTDPRLNGIMPVTAAYEMLHAGYARLSVVQRTSLDASMWAYYEKYVSSPEIHQQMASYAKTEPGAKYDELYSVLGTEVMNLSPQLERHYKLYFTNRQTIVKTYLGYEAEFTQRQQQIASDDLQLSNLKYQITADQTKLSSWQVAINTQAGQMKTLLNNNAYNAYNSLIPVYNNQVNAYNQLLAQTKSLITQYNNLVNTRNSLALEEQQLVQSLNSSSLPALPTK